MVTTDELVAELEREARATRRVLERVPGDRLDWRPHERSMTLGELAMHVAMLPAAIAELAARDGFDVRTQVGLPGAESAGALVATLDESVARAGARLREMDDAALAATWRMLDGEREVASMPRVALLRSLMLNHWYHHRGQLTVYLRQTGVPVPAIYGPSADEDPFAA